MMPNTVVLHDWGNSDAEQDSYPVRLGRGIAALRELRQWSRKALANRLGVSPNRLGFWERGVNLPRGKRMDELMLVLEVTPAELLTAGDETSTPSPDHEGPEAFERRRTMSSDMSGVVEQGPVVLPGVIEPDLKSERLQEESVAPDPLGTDEDPDLKSERLQDE
jgi:transcriptional regulator with XRE-family HTH domain